VDEITMTTWRISSQLNQCKTVPMNCSLVQYCMLSPTNHKVVAECSSVANYARLGQRLINDISEVLSQHFETKEIQRRRKYPD